MKLSLVKQTADNADHYMYSQQVFAAMRGVGSDSKSAIFRSVWDNSVVRPREREFL